MAGRFAQSLTLLGCFWFCSLLSVRGQHLRGSGEQAAKMPEMLRDCDKMLAMDYDTMPNQVPTAWQLGNCRQGVAGRQQYDLAVVGAGIGGAYIIDQLRGDSQHIKKIALFEWAEHAGGRLQSSYDAGQLGLLTQPYDEHRALAPPEYGGMRIDPMKYPLVWAAVEKQYKALHGEEGCCKLDCCIADPKVCCPNFLVQMDVGNVHYHTSKEETGTRLSHSAINDANSLYHDHVAKYSVGDIDRFENFTPFVQCLLLGLGADYYYANVSRQEAPFPAEKAFSEACTKPACSKFGDKWCELCALFPKPSQAVVSCTGYDLSVTEMPLAGITGLMKEVVNADSKTYLFLFLQGFQRFAQNMLLGMHNQVGIAPMYGKKLIKIGIGKTNAVQNALQLAAAQAKRFSNLDFNSSMQPESEPDESGPITLYFEDGSVTTANMVYLTMLPLDLLKVEGLSPWAHAFDAMMLPHAAVKLVLSWNEFDIAGALGLTPCVTDKGSSLGWPGLCDRLILDGPGPWMARQVWLWDSKTIMFYQVAPADNAEAPANRIINMAQTQGMGALIEEMVKQLNASVGNVSIPMPDWGRLKPWPKGSLMISWKQQEKGKAFSEFVSRPFGNSVNVFYGNSEAAANGDNHGWAEGALEMANSSLPAMNHIFDKMTQ